MEAKGIQRAVHLDPCESGHAAQSLEKKSDATCGLVFPTTGCKPKQNFLDECKAIAKRAELNKEEFYLHKFRATRATRLLQGGMDIKSVQQMLGHNDLESQCAIWAHSGQTFFRRR